MNSRSRNRPYVIVLTRFPGGEPHTHRLKALQLSDYERFFLDLVIRPHREPL